MKQVFFLCVLTFTGTIIFSQQNSVSYPGVLLEIGRESDVWASRIVVRTSSNVTKKLPQGTRVMGRRLYWQDEINHVQTPTIGISYGNNDYDILASDLVPVGSGRLPMDWITIIDAPKKWIILYYLDALRSQDRDVFLVHEQEWIKWNTERSKNVAIAGPYPGEWYELFSRHDYFESLNFFNAAIVMGGFGRRTFFITEITPLDTGYKITVSGDFVFAHSEFSSPSIYPNNVQFPLWSERPIFDMIFIPDGDYMDVYLDTFENHIASFASVDAVYLDELENLVKTNTVDLSRITSWPRRADGSMDYPPPVDMSNFNATHRTTNRLRVRDNPDTTSLIVTTLDSDMEVQVLETGRTETISGVTAQWVRVLSANGFTGWCFSGFLESLAVIDADSEYEPVEVATTIMTKTNVSTESGGVPVWVWVVIACSALALVGIVGVVVKRKKS